MIEYLRPPGLPMGLLNLVAATLFLAGCSGFMQRQTPTPVDQAAAEAVFGRLTHRNDTLDSFKGIGKARIRSNGADYHARLAWIGARPANLRVEMMGAPGQPKSGFATDGTELYYYDNRDESEPVKRISIERIGLSRVISISISPRDIVSVFSGRIPDYAPHSLRGQALSDGTGYRLTLTKKWWQGGRQEIYLDDLRRELQKIEVYTADRLVYRIEVLKMQTVQGFQVPAGLRLSNADGDSFHLQIDRYWANVPAGPDLFRLAPPLESPER